VTAPAGLVVRDVLGGAVTLLPPTICWLRARRPVAASAAGGAGSPGTSTAQPW
jgi:hypothetical protein